MIKRMPIIYKIRHKRRADMREKTLQYRRTVIIYLRLNCESIYTLILIYLSELLHKHLYFVKNI